jgi:hypothetical protein
VADLAGAAGGVERRDAVLDRHGRVHPVQLEEVDALDAQSRQRLVHLPGERRRRGVADELRRGELVDAALGGDDDPAGVGVQGVGDQRFVVAGPVGERGVEEADAELDGAAQQRLAPLTIRVGPKVAGLAGQAHGAEADAGHD